MDQWINEKAKQHNYNNPEIESFNAPAI